MYRIVEKKQNESWDNVSRRFFGTPERSGDLEKLNNNIEQGEVFVYDEADEENKNDKTGVVVEVEGEYFRFQEYSLIGALEAIKAGVFVSEFFGVFKQKFKANQRVKVYNNGRLFLHGRIANIKTIKTKNSNHIQLEIKSNLGILIESVCPYPLDYDYQSVETVITTLLGYFGLEAEFLDNEESKNIFQNELGTSFSALDDETVFHFICRICASRGLVVFDTGTKLRILGPQDLKTERINFIEGETIGIRKIRADFNCDNLARYYEINSQYPSPSRVVITTPYLVPVTKRLKSNDINGDNIEQTARLLVCKEIAKHFMVEVELDDDFLIDIGDLVIVKYPSIQIEEETEFIVRDVVYEEGSCLKVVLVLPCAYTGIIPERLPMN